MNTIEIQGISYYDVYRTKTSGDQLLRDITRELRRLIAVSGTNPVIYCGRPGSYTRTTIAVKKLVPGTDYLRNKLLLEMGSRIVVYVSTDHQVAFTTNSKKEKHVGRVFVVREGGITKGSGATSISSHETEMWFRPVHLSDEFIASHPTLAERVVASLPQFW